MPWPGCYTQWRLQQGAAQSRAPALCRQRSDGPLPAAALPAAPPVALQDWQQAEVEYMRHAPFASSNPNKSAYLNPFRHNIPPSKAIIME